ncbi:ABC transporter ATP-binding protein [Sneathiella sp.]|uniref:ABC transporter ATP-binding protein n=1 Tax=Sneathiella sp. TaxID=1964365 RepID=UPI0035645C05
MGGNSVSDTAVLEADGLCLKFGAVQALKSVSLTVEDNHIHAIIGPNGAGKSSLLNCLSGFYRAQSGSVRFRSEDISALPPRKRAAMGISRTFQGIQTYPHLTARENIMTGYHGQMKSGIFRNLIYWGATRREEEEYTRKAEEIIDFLELEEARNMLVGDMPYGLRKRVDLGRALALDPKLLIMDEPMAGMGPEEKGDLARFILDIRTALTIPIILVEHDMEVVMDISDRITVVDFGEVIASGTPDEIGKNERVISAYLGGTD